MTRSVRFGLVAFAVCQNLDGGGENEIDDVSDDSHASSDSVAHDLGHKALSDWDLTLRHLPDLEANKSSEREDKEHEQNAVGVEDVPFSLRITDFHVVPKDVSRLIGK